MSRKSLRKDCFIPKLELPIMPAPKSGRINPTIKNQICGR